MEQSQYKVNTNLLQWANGVKRVPLPASPGRDTCFDLLAEKVDKGGLLGAKGLDDLLADPGPKAGLNQLIVHKLPGHGEGKELLAVRGDGGGDFLLLALPLHGWIKPGRPQLLVAVLQRHNFGALGVAVPLVLLIPAKRGLGLGGLACACGALRRRC